MVGRLKTVNGALARPRRTDGKTAEYSALPLVITAENP